jgi:hydrogenase maturation protein HypF
MPGGDAAIRQPWRMACAWVDEACGPGPPPARLARLVDPGAWEKVQALLRSGVASPVTTSAGRLFDAASALCGIRTEANYEGQAAIELEAAADPRERGSYALPVVDEGGGPIQLDARETVRAMLADLHAGASPALAAARFHNAIAAATARACAIEAERVGVRCVVLSGGVFQNRLLLARTAGLIADCGLRVLTPERLPPNDGGIAYGQLAVAAARPGGGTRVRR